VKQVASTTAGEKKVKAEKDKKAEEATFVNTTPSGEKKGKSLVIVPIL
jgi:valyl-tRNA synthetase